MARLFFGKFGSDKPEQITERFYAAGPKGDTWYGGIEPGDLVYPIFEGKVIALWKVKGYTNKPNRINKNDPGVVEFDVVSSFPSVPVAQFIRNPAFSLDINLLNKAVKSFRGCGFFEITLDDNTSVDSLNVDLSQKQNFYIALQDQSLPNDEKQIVVVIDNLKDTRIINIIRRSGENIELYEPLMKLYERRNLQDERYTLKELLHYANNEAPNKAKYISTVLHELNKQGWYAVSNPVQLYDNILVGRRRTPKSKDKNSLDSNSSVSYMQEINEDVIEIQENYKRYAELLEFNPNLVLYGPPGTGKTYATKKIIEAFENRNSNQTVPFEQVEREGRVKFVTFHQSYSYEEFIEGIRPRFNTDEASESGGSLQYGIENGILKDMATAAFTQTLKSELKSDLLSNTKESSRIWKVSLGKRSDDQTYERCKQNNWIAVGWLSNHNLAGKNYEDIYNILKSERGPGAQEPGNDASTLDSIVNEMNEGDIVLIYDSPTTIRDVGVIRSGYKYFSNESFPHIREVAWLKEFEQPYDIYDANGRTRLTLKTIYELTRLNMSDIQQMIQADHATDAAAAVQQADEPKPYYLIIDEINRGNISKIFGELITLIEKDKRQTLSVTLPYSQKPFTLPRNLYLIGTMNTADRSITALDTALRRRFAFVEIEPDYSVFTDPNLNLSAMVNDVVDLEKLLRTLNERILNHLDRDHRIGQAYFMDVLSISDLYHTWYYKVLPLISEYFYNDAAAVKKIVGSQFYDQYGSMIFLNQHREGREISEFERALMGIYKGKANDE